MWIYKALLCLVLAVNSECRGKGRKSTLQKYEKSDDTRLVCSRCPLPVLVRSSTSRDHCARKCSRNKRFTCRGFYFENHTGKCYLLPFDRFSNGTLREHKANTDLYERKDYVRNCILGSGASYRGGRSVTKTNISCQAWSTKYPHEPRREFQLAKRGKDLRENFCRNPDNHSSGPWCYTLDPKIRFESCGLPQCSEVECMRCNGEDYRGPMDHTESGKECQRWDSMKPHKHHYLPQKYPDKGLKDNYCRNPDGRERPWCYTMVSNKTWEYCSISECDPGNHTNMDVTTSCLQDQGLSYRGTVNVTSKGVTCQRWDSQFPHNHSYSPQNYKCKDLRENYCRNPDGADLPWCFTTDPNQRLAYCTNIPRCQTKIADPEECYEDNGENYRGHLSKTRSGILCALWSDHSNSRDLHSAITGEGMVKNLCRNPDRDKHGPWCYTTDPSIPWDYCQLKRCKDKSPRVTHQISIKPSCFVHITTRIVGGAEVNLAKDGSWVVSIQKGNNHWCGGSLIREEWVLTDQQCFSSCVPDLSEYSVQVGLLHLNSSSLHPRLHIAHVVCGPEGSNLALLKLTQPAPLSEHAFTIQLPVAGCSVMEGTNCLMYGWGETKGTGYEESLKSVSLPMVSNELCSQLHSGSLSITENKVCAGGRKDQGVCDKDYGGPLVCQEQKRKVIVGVSIHGRGCALARRPAVFVNVAFYSEWIHKVFRHYSFERNYY